MLLLRTGIVAISTKYICIFTVRKGTFGRALNHVNDEAGRLNYSVQTGTKMISIFMFIVSM